MLWNVLNSSCIFTLQPRSSTKQVVINPFYWQSRLLWEQRLILSWEWPGRLQPRVGTCAESYSLHASSPGRPSRGRFSSAENTMNRGTRQGWVRLMPSLPTEGLQRPLGPPCDGIGDVWAQRCVSHLGRGKVLPPEGRPGNSKWTFGF